MTRGDGWGPTSPGPGLVLNKVGFTYRRGSSTALADVSFETPRCTVALLGPNGAGKSTLMSLLAGALPLQSGEISLAGHSLADRGSKRRLQATLGYVPQNLRMFGAYRCADLLRYVAWLRKVDAGVVESRIASALELVDLQAQAGVQISKLSGGMRQRLAIAQALVNEPSVVVMDEPTAGLDPEHRADVRASLMGLARDRMVVIASHLVEDVALLAQHVVILKDGRVCFSGSTEDLATVVGGAELSGPALERAYLAVVRGSSVA